MMGSRFNVCSALALAALALPMAGCNESVSSSERSSLSGRSFVATSARGFDLPVGSALRLTFDGLRLQMSGGCNSGFADYDVVDGLLVLQPMSITEMACDQPMMELDTSVMNLLAGGPTVRLQGDQLTLAAGGRTLQLEDRRVQSDRELEGTLWVVDTVIIGEQTVVGFGGALATVLFRNGGALVNGGCNTGSISAVIGATTIEFGQLSLTRMACAQTTMELEFMVAVVLQGTVTHVIADDQLTLLNGDNGLVLRAAAEA